MIPSPDKVAFFLRKHTCSAQQERQNVPLQIPGDGDEDCGLSDVAC